MADPPLIEVGSDGRVVRERRSPLAGRRVVAAAVLALIEVVAIVVWDPGLAPVVLGTFALAVLALWTAFRVVKRGFLRDLLVVIGLSQVMVVAIPLALGIGFLAALVVAVLLVLGVIGMVIRSRV